MTEPLARTPEPELMDSPAQVEAYAGADFAESNQWFADTLAEELAERPPGRLVDLGCGPADICIRVARARPRWRVVGADAGANMLDTARRRIEAEGLSDRIDLVRSRLPDPCLPARAFDCIASNSLLHHLPEPATLWREIIRLGAPGAHIQVMDLARPDSESEATALVNRYAEAEPAILKQDFHNSLHAAWRVDEVRDQLRAAGLALTCERVSDRHWLVSGRLPASTDA